MFGITKRLAAVVAKIAAATVKREQDIDKLVLADQINRWEVLVRTGNAVWKNPADKLAGIKSK